MASIELTDTSSRTAAVSNLVVRLLREYTGRGPTRARTYINGDVVTVILQDALTKAERTLAGSGHRDLVLNARRVLHDEMRGDVTAGVRELLGREVMVCLSATSLDPDVVVETFILVPATSAGHDRAQ